MEPPNAAVEKNKRNASDAAPNADPTLPERVVEKWICYRDANRQYSVRRVLMDTTSRTTAAGVVKYHLANAEQRSVTTWSPECEIYDHSKEAEEFLKRKRSKNSENKAMDEH